MLVPTKGLAGLIFMLLFMAVMLVYVPATRLLLLFSVPLGIIVALILSLWHRRKPVEKTENKRPLGL
jgi:membrane protein implicated in regulation of membrane protease activity